MSVHQEQLLQVLEARNGEVARHDCLEVTEIIHDGFKAGVIIIILLKMEKNVIF